MKSEIDGRAVVSLLFGFMSISIPFTGVIFGIIGVVIALISLYSIRKTQKKGIGLVIFGLILSGLGIM